MILGVFHHYEFEFIHPFRDENGRMGRLWQTDLKSHVGFRKNYLQPALEAGLIGMTEPDKPTSKN